MHEQDGTPPCMLLNIQKLFTSFKKPAPAVPHLSLGLIQGV